MADSQVLTLSEDNLPRPRETPMAARVLMVAVAVLGISYIIQVHLYLNWPVLEVQYLAVVLALALGAVFLVFPVFKGKTHLRGQWYDYILTLVSLAMGAYVAVKWPDVLVTPKMTPEDVAFGVVGTLIIIEATRRVLGWPLVFFAIGSIALALWGNSIELHRINYPWQRWFYFFLLDEMGIYGNILDLMATVVLGFVVFGRILTYSGGGQSLINLTTSLVGRYTGGAAKAAVVASAGMGTITGSPSVNAVSVGTITIPMMKQGGYKPDFAAGVECAASTGGAIMPPVMGVTAFLAAQFLNLPYYQVALAAALPAVIYYTGLFAQVEGAARRLHLKGMPKEQVPPRGKAAMEALPFLVPVAVIIYTLFALRIAPERVGLYGGAAAFAVGLFYPVARKKLLNIPRLLEEVGRGFLELAVVGAVAGLIVSPLVLSGLGLGLVTGLTNMAGGNLFLLLLLAAVANLILGLGLPAIVSYILLAVLVAPAMIQIGVPPLAAHLFTIYYAVAAEVTPPAGAPIYITMTIAKASFTKTAISGMRLASPMFILPFAIVYRPGLILAASFEMIVIDFFLTLAGITALALSFEGYVGRRQILWERCMLGLAGVCLLIPVMEVNLLGALLGLGYAGYWWGTMVRRKGRVVAEAEN